MKNMSRGARRYALPTGVAAGVLAVGLIGGSSVSAKSGVQASRGPATITMELNKKGPRFQGAQTVRAGHSLRILNNTAPSKIGPHTFSLVKRSLIPTTRTQQNACFPKGICGIIGKAHQINETTHQVGRPVVKAGIAGWGRRFTFKTTGDSWFTQKKGATFTQKVTAKPGAVLYYMCAIHPEMHGKITVVH